jgi:uncharacterized membrane protein HdeD (DUF308 family)
MEKLQLKNWIFMGLNGFLAIIFGLVSLLFPTITLIALAIYFAISILIGGIVLTIGSLIIRNDNSHWHLVLIEGVIGILLGIIILLRPELSAAVFVTIIGIWAIIIGLIFWLTWYTIKLPNSGKSFLLITGIISFAFGILIVINPFEGSRFITILIGIYAISYGLFSIITNNKKS